MKLAAGIIDGLFLKLGFDVEQDKLDKFNKGMAKGGQIVKKVGLAVIGLVTSFTLLFIAMSKQALAQTRFAKNIGTSRASIEAFERTSRELTGSSGTGKSMLEMFSSITNAFKAGVAPSTEFQRGLRAIGLDFTDFAKLSPDEQLLQIAEGFQKLSKDEQDAAQHLLGFNQEQRTLAANLTRTKFANSLPTDAEIKGMEQMNRLTSKFSNTMKDAATTVGNQLVPVLLPMLDSLAESLPVIIGLVGDLAKGFFWVGESLGELAGFLHINVLNPLMEIHKLLTTMLSDLFTQIDNLDLSLSNLVPGGRLINSGIDAVSGLFGGGDTTNNKTSSVTNKNDININVSSSDPVAAGNQAASSLEGVLNNQARGFRTDDKI